MTRKQPSKPGSKPLEGEGAKNTVEDMHFNSHDSCLDIRVITHNIRYATESPFEGEERWPIRSPRLCSELIFNSTSIPETFICLQEVLHTQLVDVLFSLNESAPGNEWGYIGVGRDDGKHAGEYSPIFYRTSIWAVKRWRTVWLSETPSKPSKGWDAGNPRIVTVGVFQHAKTGKQVLVMNTHLDNKGVRSREESAKIILNVVESETKTVDPSAVLLAGDFNSPPDDGAYQVMTGPNSAMEDVGVKISVRRRYGNEMTFTSFGHVDNDPSRIDFIFSRKSDHLKYKTYAVLANRFDDGGGNDCVVRAKARPMRSRNMRSSTLPNKNHSPIFDDSEFSINLPPVSSPDTRKDILALHRRHKEFFGEDGPSESRGSQNSSDQLQTGPLLIEQRKISLSDSQELLSIFRLKAPFFPFVDIPIDATVPSLSKSSPFLLLAVLTCASIKDAQLFTQMNNEFRRVLSLKVIVEGQKSLDFLQGLLVYLAWYPMLVNPKNNQSFMYMNLAVSLATDLGLDQAYPNLSSFSAICAEGLIENDMFTQAAKKAYLGCYFLSSSLSLGFQKPNSFQYRQLMDIHLGSLAESESKGDIHSLIRLQRLNERISDLHANKQLAGDPRLDSLNAELNAQIFLNELQEWRGSVPDDLSTTRSFIALSERFVGLSIYSYELGFHRKPYREHLRSPQSKELVIQSHLTNCLDAAKRFFECLLSLPESSYLSFTFVQWGLMVQAVLILSRLTFLMAANRGWNSDAARTNVPLVMYLDCLCYRFQHLSSTKVSPEDSEHPKNPDVLYVFKLLLASVKKSYERRIGNIKPETFAIDFGNGAGPARGHCPILDPNLRTFLSSPEDSTYGGSFNRNSATSDRQHFGMPLYHDLWATMTCNWAGSI
ncbi:hypothetical protein LSUE1_G008616 [Lachnellula suecica]|uniref:Endonuclease/exonuclease/phosphatase domain-containing protein n=1 Tax=Lachnellula suecica TaxID=602035 RepID=A0A8T9C422_9HELO|nr:hypothetical protein LSUE1_G008616 [Lachnellula suecica]